MEQITSGLGALAAAAPVLMAGAVWMSPEALRWCIMRLSMRVAYIEAGRTAAQVERDRFEVAA
jgi:hypothetical protein